MKKISMILFILSSFSLGLAQEPGGPTSSWFAMDNSAPVPAGREVTNLNPETTCVPGDFNGDGFISNSDWILLLIYLSKCGSPPTCLPNEANGNCELDFGDVFYLINFIFKGGPSPISYCSNPDSFLDPGSTDTVRIGTVGGCPGDTVLVPVYVNNDENIYLYVPLRIDTSKVKCDGVITTGTRGAGVVSTANPVYCGDSTGLLINSGSTILTAGSGAVGYLRCIIKVEDSGLVAIDTATLGKNQLRFFKEDTYSIKPNFVSGGIYVACPTNFKVTIRAFSPVNLVVTDPVTDSIGLDTNGIRPDTIFNTVLAGSTYDTTLDANSDGEKDIIVTIPTPYNGPYQIRVVPTDTGKFSLDYQAGNNLRVELASSVVITTTDTNFTYGLEVLPFLRGDVNKDRSRGLTDIIYMKNRIFGSGPPPDPPELGDVKCNGGMFLDDLIYMVNYVFKFGPPPCS